MLIRLASDLHLEAFSGQDGDALRASFVPEDAGDDLATLVLAGDISSQPDQLVSFIAACLGRFSSVVFVPGNHEYYRHNYDAWNKTMNDRLGELRTAFLPKGSHLYFSTDKVETVDIGGVRFIFGSMWADGGPTLADAATTGRYLNDFRLIKRDDPLGSYPRNFTVSDMVAIYRKQKADIEAALRQPFVGKTVVVTHHLPSRHLVSERFWPGDGSDGANGGFVGYCDDLLAADHAPALWMHGHTHDSIDTRLWNTRIACNPAGYRGEWYSKFNDFMRTEDGQRVVVPRFINTEDL